MADEGFASPLLSLVDKGVGLLLGTTDDHHVPRGTRAWGVRVVGDRVLRVTFSADDELVVANASTGAIAITGADVRELRSAQLKGRVMRVVEPDDDDLRVAAAHTELFLDAIHETDLHDLDLIRRFLPTRMLAVEVEVCDAFDQTPGPTAGTPLAGTADGGDR
jgi:hypothetical protein